MQNPARVKPNHKDSRKPRHRMTAAMTAIPRAEASEPLSGAVRLKAILAPLGPIPVSKSTWWAGVKSGRYPKPIKFGPRITAWKAEDILALSKAGYR